MELTPETKQHIDSLSLEQLLRRWRFAKTGDEWFQGATGEYWSKRMFGLRNEPGGDDKWVEASKEIGW